MRSKGKKVLVQVTALQLAHTSPTLSEGEKRRGEGDAVVVDAK